MSGRKIDIYNHVMPIAVADRIRELAPVKGDMVKRATSIPTLYDIEARALMLPPTWRHIHADHESQSARAATETQRIGQRWRI